MINLPGSLPPSHPNAAVMGNILNAIAKDGMSVTTTNVVPTVATVQQGQAVIYDNGSGTKRIYVVTHLGNLGYISLT